MSGRPIARTLAEAKVGDLIWVKPTNRIRGKDQPAEAWTISKVGRAYIHAGRTSDTYDQRRFDKEDGYEAVRGGYSATAIAYGAAEYEAHYWMVMASTLATKVRECENIEVLKAVAAAFGAEAPPAFDTAPEEGQGA